MSRPRFLIRGSAPHPAGASPLRPDSKTKTFPRRKIMNQNYRRPRPSRWSRRDIHLHTNTRKHLLELIAKG